ncbi:MAG: type 1 glutamine amidotransferase [Solirubrobacterales bacterium]
MRALAITHQRDAGPGVFAEAIAARGVSLDEWFIAETDRPPGDPFTYDAVLTLGAAAHPDQDSANPWMRREKNLLAELLHREVPILGACLGSQLLADAAGSPARRAREPEIGWYEVEVTAEGADDPVIGALAPRFTAFEWHSYEAEVPPGAVALARSPICVQAYRVGDIAWGIQFHAEVSRDDAASWINDHQVDPDAVAMGIDPEALRAQTSPRIAEWNELGRGLCDRFLGVVAARARARAPA